MPVVAGVGRLLDDGLDDQRIGVHGLVQKPCDERQPAAARFEFDGHGIAHFGRRLFQTLRLAPTLVESRQQGRIAFNGVNLGTLDEIASAEATPWRGQVSEAPFVLVTQQSHFDPSRAPDGKHTGYVTVRPGTEPAQIDFTIVGGEVRYRR